MERGMEAPRNIVGPQVIAIRNQLGWSQSKLASVCQLQGWDVSRGVIARIEGQVKWVCDTELLELAKALKVQVPELFPKKNRRAFLPKSAS
jgi:transcriptional regulator with XRE-family HTH domain